MACGCGGTPANALAVTSGDLVDEPVQVTAESATFKVVPDDGGEPAYFATYRAARIYHVSNGGKLRAT